MFSNRLTANGLGGVGGGVFGAGAPTVYFDQNPLRREIHHRERVVVAIAADTDGRLRSLP